MSDTNPTAKQADAPKPSNDPISRGYHRAIDFVKGLPRPIVILVASALAVGLVLSVWLGAAPMMEDYTVLYSELEGGDASAIVEELKKKNVPYRLSGEGKTIEVRKSEVYELRLEMAAKGIPQGGQLGFESFRDMRLGATEFEQQVTYRTAMEGELAKTIATVKQVQSARVHLVLPKKSVFSTKSQPATASVVLRLRGGERLSPGEVKGIVHLVASAVESLGPDQVTLVTTDGEMLHRPRAEGEEANALGDEGELEEGRRYEQRLEDNARAMLERVLGPGHVDVRVRAELSTARVERKTENYDPKTTSLRSEHLVVERATGAKLPEDTVAGVPGAESNLPTGDAVPAASEAASDKLEEGALRHTHTRNWEVDKIEERRVSVSRDVKRLTVAVVVDGAEQVVDGKTIYSPRSAEDVERLSQLVRRAVGYDEKRGDEVTVESVAFFSDPVDAAPAAPPELLPIPEKFQKWVPLAKYGAIALAVLVAGLILRRKLNKRRAEAEATEAAKVIELNAAPAAAQLEAPAIEQDKLLEEKVDAKAMLEEHRASAIESAQTDPATAALIIRRWLGTAHDEETEAEVA